MKKTIYCLVCLLLVVFSLKGQEYLNFGFEKQSIEGRSRPWGWNIVSTTSGGQILMDDSTKRSGKYSLRTSSTDSGRQSSTSLRYWIQPYSLKNKPLRLRGWLKKKAFSGTVKIALESYRGEGLLTDSAYKEISTTEMVNGWSDFNLEFSVSDNVHSIYLTISVNGPGSVWFDQFELYSGKIKISSPAVAADITAVQLKSLAAYVYPFDRVMPAKNGTTDNFNGLTAFRRIAGDAQIIALGECTHGTSEFFSMKHRLLEFAVKKMKVGVFALEANQLNVELINDYVHTGKGDLQKLMAKTLFAVWNTREVFDLIEWVKWYNAQSTSGKKISFMGYDMQDPSLPIDSLESFVRRREPGLYPLIHRLLFDLRVAWQKQNYPQADDNNRLSWQRGADSVMLLIDQRKKNWMEIAVTENEKTSVEWAVQNARVIMQSANLSFEGTITYRDSCMAQNVQWIMQQHPGKKMILWAHDTHVCYDGSADPTLNYNEGITMGTYLRRKYDSNYRAFGFATYQGNYTSTLSYTNFRYVNTQLYPSPKGSLDEALHRLTKTKGSQYLIADLRPFLHKPSNHWMQRARPVRFITYASSDYGYEQYVSLPWQFDAIVFIDRTSGSKMLR